MITENTKKLISELKKNSEIFEGEWQTTKDGSERYRYVEYRLKYKNAHKYLVVLFNKVAKENGYAHSSHIRIGDYIQIHYDRPQFVGQPFGSMSLSELHIVDAKTGKPINENYFKQNFADGGNVGKYNKFVVGQEVVYADGTRTQIKELLLTKKDKDNPLGLVYKTSDGNIVKPEELQGVEKQTHYHNLPKHFHKLPSDDDSKKIILTNDPPTNPPSSDDGGDNGGDDGGDNGGDDGGDDQGNNQSNPQTETPNDPLSWNLNWFYPINEKDNTFYVTKIAPTSPTSSLDDFISVKLYGNEKLTSEKLIGSYNYQELNNDYTIGEAFQYIGVKWERYEWKVGSVFYNKRTLDDGIPNIGKVINVINEQNGLVTLVVNYKIFHPKSKNNVVTTLFEIAYDPQYAPNNLVPIAEDYWTFYEHQPQAPQQPHSQRQPQQPHPQRQPQQPQPQRQPQQPQPQRQPQQPKSTTPQNAKSEKGFDIKKALEKYLDVNNVSQVVEVNQEEVSKNILMNFHQALGNYSTTAEKETKKALDELSASVIAQNKAPQIDLPNPKDVFGKQPQNKTASQPIKSVSTEPNQERLSSVRGVPSTNPSTWNAKYNVGDRVKIRIDFADKVGGYDSPRNSFIIQKVDSSGIKYAKRNENPSGLLYILSNNGGNWEGKDIELI